MKIKAGNKKGKKGPLGETSLPPKPGQKQKSAIKSKKSLKKPKLAISGRLKGEKREFSVKKMILESLIDKLENSTKDPKEDNVLLKPSEQKTLNAKKVKELALPKMKVKPTMKMIDKLDKKLKFLEKKPANHTPTKQEQKQKGTAKSQKAPLSKEEIKTRIETILSRDVLSKTAKKQLSSLKKKLILMESGIALENASAMGQKKNKKNRHKNVKKNKQDTNADDKVKAKKTLENKKDKHELKDDDDDDDDSSIKDVSDEDEFETEEQDESMDVEDVEDVDDSEDNKNEKVANEQKGSKKMKNKKKKKIVQSPIDKKKGEKEKKRFFLRVKNLPSE